MREASRDPGVWQGFEWLAADAASRDADRGVQRDDVELALYIEHFRQAIELEEALRTMPVRLTATPIAVTTVRPEHATPAPADVAAPGRG